MPRLDAVDRGEYIEKVISLIARSREKLYTFKQVSRFSLHYVDISKEQDFKVH